MIFSRIKKELKLINSNPFFAVLQTHSVTHWSSSTWECMTTPELARLSLNGYCRSSWCGRVGDWLQLDLGRDWKIRSIMTQGARDSFGFTKNYTLSYKPSDGSWQDYIEPGESAVKVLNGIIMFFESCCYS